MTFVLNQLLTLSFTAVRRRIVAVLGAIQAMIVVIRRQSTATVRVASIAALPLRRNWLSIAHVGSLALAGVRIRPISVLITLGLVMFSGRLVYLPVPLVVLVWATGSLLALETCFALEPFVLRRAGCRMPSRLERERLEPASSRTRIPVEILVIDRAEPWVGRGLRCLVITRALFDLLEDRALVGILTQAASRVHAASLAGEIVVWLGNLPLLAMACVSRLLVQLGRLLALLVGASLVLPLLLCPQGFTRWVGRLFGAMIVGLLGSAFLSSGFAAVGVGLLLSWAVVPGLQNLVRWEWRRTEWIADSAVITAGVGQELREALELLAITESSQKPSGVVGLLGRSGAPVAERADRLWRKLSEA